MPETMRTEGALLVDQARFIGLEGRIFGCVAMAHPPIVLVVRSILVLLQALPQAHA